MLSLVARAVVPFDYGMVLSDLNIGLLCCHIFARCLWNYYYYSRSVWWGRPFRCDTRTKGKKWVCTWSVERSTLQVWAYRARAPKSFPSFINRALVGHFSGPGSISGSQKKKIFLFAPQIKRKGCLLKPEAYI
ncbi:hypothetical protein Leryth_024571 [Lithospermum erythrorhizon]|nr:hypothetical protein Leryth_024571 [Lithospermum erythrorhizon]